MVRTRLRPLAGSKAGRRARPLSMTIETPSTVTLDSARSVATTTRRRAPAHSARSCSAAGSVPCSGSTSTPARPPSAADRGADLPDPGEEDEDIPGITLERMMHRRGDTVAPDGCRVAAASTAGRSGTTVPGSTRTAHPRGGPRPRPSRASPT